MLVLTRKLGESIAIGDSVKVRVIQIKGKQVRLGIDAPQDTKIYREEVFLSLQNPEEDESFSQKNRETSEKENLSSEE